jgi:hypothetical protein
MLRQSMWTYYGGGWVPVWKFRVKGDKALNRWRLGYVQDGDHRTVRD